jgi:hypothetical protein
VASTVSARAAGKGLIQPGGLNVDRDSAGALPEPVIVADG